MANYKQKFERRKLRVRRRLKKHAKGKPRLSVYRSGKNIYAQIIDDLKGATVAQASSLDKGLKIKNGGNIEAAQKIGKEIATRAKKAGVEEVVFDRGGYLFHGRVKALAEAAREGGLKF